MEPLKNLFGEFIGTFFLVTAGTGAIVVDSLYNNSIGNLGIATTFGVVVMVIIYALGDVSGAHINPAVSFGFFVCGSLSLKKALNYSVAQSAGAICGSAFINYILPPNSVFSGMTIPSLTTEKAFIVEVLITCLLMFVISQVATGSKEKGIMAGVAIGATVGLCALVFGPLTGASMNPARSLGPAVIEGNFSGLWIYILAPLSGSALAIMLLKIFKLECCCKKNPPSC